MVFDVFDLPFVPLPPPLEGTRCRRSTKACFAFLKIYAWENGKIACVAVIFFKWFDITPLYSQSILFGILGCSFTFLNTSKDLVVFQG